MAPFARGDGTRPRKRCRSNATDSSQPCPKLEPSLLLNNIYAVPQASEIGAKVQFLFVVIEATLNDDPDQKGERPRADRWGTFRPPATYRGFGDGLYGIIPQHLSSPLSSISSSSSEVALAGHSGSHGFQGHVFRYVNGTVTEAASTEDDFEYSWERDLGRGGRGHISRWDFPNNTLPPREVICPEYATRTVFDCGPRNPVVVAEGDASAIPHLDSNSSDDSSSTSSSSEDEDNAESTDPNRVLNRERRLRNRQTRYFPLHFHIPRSASHSHSTGPATASIPIRIAHPRETAYHIDYHCRYASRPVQGIPSTQFPHLPAGFQRLSPVPRLPPSFPTLSRQMPRFSAASSYFTGTGGPIPWIFEPPAPVGVGAAAGGYEGLTGDLATIIGMLALTSPRGKADDVFSGGRWSKGAWKKQETTRPVIRQGEGRGVIVHVAFEPGDEIDVAEARRQLERLEKWGVILKEGW